MIPKLELGVLHIIAIGPSPPIILLCLLIYRAPRANAAHMAVMPQRTRHREPLIHAGVPRGAPMRWAEDFGVSHRVRMMRRRDGAS
jgi:hypothetical protein